MSVQKQLVWEGKNGISTHRETGNMQRDLGQIEPRYRVTGRLPEKTDLQSGKVHSSG